MEKSNVDQLVYNYSNILIRAAKIVNPGVIRVETLERWQRLKVHGISVARYLGEEKIEILYQEIKSSMRILLKIVSCQLINESQLEKYLKSGIGRRFAIVIMVSTSEEVGKLCSKRLRFDRALKVVKKYWEAKPGLVCLSCARISHNY